MEPALAKPPDLGNRELCTSALFAAEFSKGEQFFDDLFTNEQFANELIAP